MEIKVSFEELRKKKLFVATPMYGGQCHGMFAKSMADLSAICAKYGIEMRAYYLFNESLITRARNYCVDEFMRSDYTHMMFIDSDIGFNPQDILALMALQGSEPGDDPYDVIGGPYPKKCISWEKVIAAVNQGVADDDPNQLENYVGDYVFNPVVPKGGQAEIRLDEPADVLEIGTGFMMTRRATFEKYAEAYPDFMYKPDHVRTEHFDGTREIMMYFQALIDPESKRYLSEDYMFCQWARKIGLKTFICPWMQLQHVGSYVFGGSLQHLAAVGASATADKSKIKTRSAK
jgi:hypothetical protein